MQTFWNACRMRARAGRAVSASFAAGLLLLLGAWPAQAIPTEILVNGDFGTGTMAGWTLGVTPSPGGGITTQLCCDSRFATGTGAAATGSELSRISGNYSAFGDFDGGVRLDVIPQYQDDVSIFMSQTFTKNGAFSSALLSFDFQVAGGQYHDIFIDSPAYEGHIDIRQFVVHVSDGTTDAQAYVYDVPDGLLGVHALQHVALDISSLLNGLMDGTITVTFERFVPQYFTGEGYFVGDNFSLLAEAAPTQVPEPATLGVFGVGLLGLAAIVRRRKVVTVSCGGGDAAG